MKYIGKLYGKLAGKTFDTGKTSDDWDKLETTNKELRDENKKMMSEIRSMVNQFEKDQSEITKLREELAKMTQSRDSWEEMQGKATREWKECIVKIQSQQERIKELEKAVSLLAGMYIDDYSLIPTNLRDTIESVNSPTNKQG